MSTNPFAPDVIGNAISPYIKASLAGYTDVEMVDKRDPVVRQFSLT